jgi:hypothetical protein
VAAAHLCAHAGGDRRADVFHALRRQMDWTGRRVRSSTMPTSFCTKGSP